MRGRNRFFAADVIGTIFVFIVAPAVLMTLATIFEARA